ncbi:type-4 ice-structuring protein LS-12-like [Osmerus eperlanus]|uniref:type-4 ice-structuring protein LS-12-like n=1 Tax=Osmerus eperlanus TaxID=29151 RepID=UPI002E10D406
MKFSLIAAVLVVLAFANGSQSAEAPELDKLKQYFEDITSQLVSATKDLSDKINAQEMAGQAQTFLQEGRTQLEPLAAQIQEQLKPLSANIEEHLKPLGENLKAQLKPMVDNFQTQMEDMLRKLMDQAKAIGN